MKIVSILGQKKVTGGKTTKGIGEVEVLAGTCLYCRQYNKHRDGCRAQLPY